MDRPFEQKRGFQSHAVQMLPYGILHTYRTFWHQQQRSVLYEELVMDRVVRGRSVDLPSSIAAFFFLALAGLVSFAKDATWQGTLVWCLIAFACGALCWLRSGAYVRIPLAQGDPIELFVIKNGNKEMDSFIEELTRVSRDYVIQKFGPLEGHGATDDQIARLRWLRDRNLLSMEDFNHRLTALKEGTVNKAGGAIGF